MQKSVTIVGLVGVLTALACGPDGSGPGILTAPQLAPSVGDAMCGVQCVLATDLRPFRASRSASDSASGTLFLAGAEVKGSKGAAISLGLSMDEQILRALGSDAMLTVTVEGGARSFRLRELSSSSVVVYRFERSTTASVTYTLSRGRARAIPAGAVRLIQSVSSAEVTSATRPWVATPRSGFAADVSSSSGCVIAAASSNVCGIDVFVDPYWGQSNVGGTFQSSEGSGVSAPITISFSAPVTSITVTVYDPTFSGNAARAYDANGVAVGTVYFTYSGKGGINVPNSRTISHAGIRSVDLIPAMNDYVAYDATFDVAPVAPGPAACASPVVTGSPKVTTEYGVKDANHPKRHLGRDYGISTGTPIYAPDSGVVKWARAAGSAGIAVIIKGGTANSYFFHLQSAAVKENQVVLPGSILGYSDNTGHSTGPHLHFEQHSPGPIWLDGHVPRATAIEPCTN